MTDADRTGQGKVSRLATSPSPSQNALARLWNGADSSYGHHLEAVAELREQKRREEELPRSVRRRYRKRESGAPDPGVPAAQAPSVPDAERRRQSTDRDEPSRPDAVSSEPMTSLRPDDLSVSALPRSPLGHLKTEAVEELLQRASWDYREVLGRNQQLANQVEHLTQRVEELRTEVGSLEEAGTKRKNSDEQARALLAAALRTARAERDAARQEAESTLKKARTRAEALMADARKRSASLSTDAEAQASALLEQVKAEAEKREQEATAAREQFERELTDAKQARAKELELARADAEAALADARRELVQLEERAAQLRSLVADMKRRIVDTARETLQELEAFGAPASKTTESDLLAGLRPVADGRADGRQAHRVAPHTEDPSPSGS